LAIGFADIGNAEERHKPLRGFWISESLAKEPAAVPARLCGVGDD